LGTMGAAFLYLEALNRQAMVTGYLVAMGGFDPM